MKRALTDNSGASRVYQVVEIGAEFPVHNALVWRECADEVTPETHVYNGSVFVLRPAPPGPPDLSDVDNVDKVLKALALLMRDYCNALQAGTYTSKTIAQLRSDFAAKYNSLP